MKKMILVGLPIIIFSVAGFRYFGSPPSFTKSIHSLHADYVAPAEKTKLEVFQTSALVNSIQPDSVTHFNDNDIRDIESWSAEHVASPDFQESDYSSYDEATLLKMADSGNVFAMKTLWFRYLNQVDTDSSDKMNKMVTNAIIHGDREMLIHMPSLIAAQSAFLNKTIDEKERKTAMIEVLAHSEFMALRGAIMEKFPQQKVFFRVYSDNQNPIKLSEDDKDLIRNRAQEIYKTYENKRIESGLGVFNNEIPEGIKKLSELQRKSYLEELGDNAI